MGTISCSYAVSAGRYHLISSTWGEQIYFISLACSNCFIMFTWNSLSKKILKPWEDSENGGNQ